MGIGGVFPAREKEGGILSKEAISRVLDAERRADEIRAAAAAEARDRVDACERACINTQKKALAAAAADLKKREDAVRARADALITQSREEAEEDIAALRAGAESRMWEAVKHIEWEVCDI